MRRRPTVALLAVLALLAGAAALVLLAGGGDGGSRSRDPHAGVGRVPRAELVRVLDAAEAGSASVPQVELVAQGRALFRSAAVAKQGESCQSCHAEGGGTNSRLGTILHPQQAGDFTGPRDPPSLWGIGRTGPYGWAGTTPGLDAFVVGTIKNHFKDGTTQSDAVTARQTAALAAYLRSLEPPVTAFDEGTLSPTALRGEGVFEGKGGCTACHGGPLLTDNALHDTGVPKVSPDDTDTGAATRGPLRGAFNTPQLRDLRNTGPYMHNGSLKTLRDVVEFYDKRSTLAPLGLTPGEVDDLVAYLESL